MSTVLFVACRSGNPLQGGWSPVGRLEFENDVYRFVYTKGAKTAEGFRPFSGMEDLEAVHESEDLFPIFANRILSKFRPEYEAFLRWSGFDLANPPDPIAILGVTEGIRQTDQIEVFPCPVPNEDGSYLTKFFLHGLRYMPEATKARVLELKEGDILFPMPDLCNSSDRNAVALRPADGERFVLGYVPRYIAGDVWKLLSQCGPDSLHLSVRRVNRDAPLQQRLLCRMTACWPEGFQPCSDEAFEPIPTTIPERAHI